MPSEISASQMGEVQLQICELVQEAINTHGNTIALAALACAAASLVGTLDREYAGCNALAAWNRSFVVMYDAAYYLPKADA
jgi:hypothetical protein